MALAYRSGVPFKPSRSGSSPKHSSISLTALDNRVSRTALSSSVASNRAFVPAATRESATTRQKPMYKANLDRLSRREIYMKLNEMPFWILRGIF